MANQSGLMSSFLIRSSFFKNQIFKDKNQNSIEIWIALTIIYRFLPVTTFDTIQGYRNLKFILSQLFFDYLVQKFE